MIPVPELYANAVLPRLHNAVKCIVRYQGSVVYVTELPARCSRRAIRYCILHSKMSVAYRLFLLI